MIVTLMLLGIALFVGYFGYRLWVVRRHGEDEGFRLGQRAAPAPRPGEASADSAPFRPAWAAPGDPSTRIAGLREVAEDAVFLKRAKDGEVVVQIGSQRATPLRYVLDPKARAVLQHVVELATKDYGQSWSVLARESEDGQIVFMRLS